jgi:signal transduction histidine kinase/ActR/RegA family two-component response regulator
VLSGLIERYERFLRIDGEDAHEPVMRVRAIWMIGLIFVALQLLNMVVMTANYGRWTYDHTIAVAAILIIGSTVQLVRWYKNTGFYAAFFTVILLIAVAGSALPEQGGINSALLPFLVLGPFLTGFLAGRRGAIMCWVVVALFMTGLFWVSLSSPSAWATGDHARDVNRYFQGLFALTMSAALTVMLSERLYVAIADMRRSAERARRAEQAKSNFLATMSHELRTPLNGVIGLTDAVLAGPLPDRERELVRTIRKSGESLLLILNDLLDLSKIESGKLAVDPHPTNLRELARFVVDSWQETAAAKGLTLDLAITGDIPDWCLLDDLRLRQILQNLVSNGVKFTASGGVTLSVHGTSRAEGGCDLVFRVADTGRGVPEALRARIFEPFEQGEAGTTRTFGGTGLGLPICRHLATLMGGTIGIETTGAKGTTFRLDLSAAPATAPAAALAETAADLDSVRILVAEDMEVNRLVLREFLTLWGAHVVFAEDGPACLQALEDGTFDLILMDKHMPGMNGADVARTIRQSDGPQADIPIIAVTADAMSGEREAMLAAGMDDFVAKPFRAETLKATIIRNLSGPRLRRLAPVPAHHHGGHLPSSPPVIGSGAP